MTKAAAIIAMLTVAGIVLMDTNRGVERAIKATTHAGSTSLVNLLIAR